MASRPTLSVAHRALLPLGACIACALAASPARADALPLRIDYEAAPTCPGADVFFDEIRWRTKLARAAAPGDEALHVRVRILRRGTVHRGHLVLGQGPDRIDREIDDESCDEVVSALAIVTALALDPNASTARKPAPVAPPPGPPPSPPPQPSPQAAAPLPTEHAAPPQIIADPLPVLIDVAPPPELPAPRWIVGARAVADVGAVPRALLGGGLFAQRGFDARFAPSLRLALDVAGTGSFDAGPGGVSFLRVLGHLQGCAFAVHAGTWLSVDPCIEAQGGALLADGVLRGSLRFVRQADIAWVGAGVVPRVGIDVGRLVVDLQGGLIFPAVRHTYVFTDPAYTIGSVPAVTGTFGLGLGGRLP